MSLQEKFESLERYDELGLASMSQAAAATKLDISQPALCKNAEEQTRD